MIDICGQMDYRPGRATRIYFVGQLFVVNFVFFSIVITHLIVFLLSFSFEV